MSAFWKEFNRRKPPYVHPRDEEYLNIKQSTCSIKSFKGYVKKNFDPNPQGLQLALYPSPYIGDLKNAKVVALLLNPGFSMGDYYPEFKSFSFKRAQLATMKQQLSHQTSKFFPLDPAFCWTPIFQWWEKKFRRLAQEVKKEFENEVERLSYSDALRSIAEIFACIELVPYHSVTFKAGRQSIRDCPLDKLPSVRASLSLVKKLAKKRGLTIYVTRKHELWDTALTSKPTAKIIRSRSARGISFAPKSPVGKAIVEAAVAQLRSR